MNNPIFCKKNTINVRGKIISFAQPLVMGIINVTPDSFFDGGSKNSIDEIVEFTKQMLFDGADIVDVGGYSSRPGASEVTAEEELNRVIPVIKSLVGEFPNIIISIDTFRSKVAFEAINAGASIINDISAGELDYKMFETVAQLKVPYIMMHTKGTPQNMQQQTNYNDLLNDVIDYFIPKINKLKALGVNDMIIDPGFGFAKTLDQNYELLQKLAYFNVLELPILVGISRKSMIYKLLNISPNEALNGTSVLNTIALQKGANIIRVHDVREARQTIALLKKTNN